MQVVTVTIWVARELAGFWPDCALVTTRWLSCGPVAQLFRLRIRLVVRIACFSAWFSISETLSLFFSLTVLGRRDVTRSRIFTLLTHFRFCSCRPLPERDIWPVRVGVSDDVAFSSFESQYFAQSASSSFLGCFRWNLQRSEKNI